MRREPWGGPVDRELTVSIKRLRGIWERRLSVRLRSNDGSRQLPLRSRLLVQQGLGERPQFARSGRPESTYCCRSRSRPWTPQLAGSARWSKGRNGRESGGTSAARKTWCPSEAPGRRSVLSGGRPEPRPLIRGFGCHAKMAQWRAAVRKLRSFAHGSANASDATVKRAFLLSPGTECTRHDRWFLKEASHASARLGAEHSSQAIERREST